MATRVGSIAWSLGGTPTQVRPLPLSPANAPGQIGDRSMQSPDNIIQEVKKTFPNLIGGVHLVNGGRQIEYKLEKPKESFNYRVRVTIAQYALSQEILRDVSRAIRKGLKLYKNHVTVVRFRSLYEYECAMVPTHIGFESTYKSYCSGFKDKNGQKKYRHFSVRKYGAALAYKLAKLNSFLIRNKELVNEYEIKHPQYVKSLPKSLKIEISFPAISFLYSMLITTSLQGIDPRVHEILADTVCEYVLEMVINIQTVKNKID